MANIKIPQLGSSQIINDTDYLIVDDGLSTMKATAKQIKEYATNDVKAEIAENWTENVNYTVGDFVNWNGAIYRCIQNNLSSESLTPANVTYWKRTTVEEEITNLKENTIVTNADIIDTTNMWPDGNTQFQVVNAYRAGNFVHIWGYWSPKPSELTDGQSIRLFRSNLNIFGRGIVYPAYNSGVGIGYPTSIEQDSNDKYFKYNWSAANGSATTFMVFNGVIID